MADNAQQNTCQHSIIPELTVKDGAQGIEYYKRAFDAQEKMRMKGPDGQSIVHAELQIGCSTFFLADEMPEMGNKSPKTLGGASSAIYLSVDDVDAVFKRAIEAGGTQEMAVEDMFWGDRMGSIIDPFGHHWSIATHKEDVSEEEMMRRGNEFFAQMA